MKKILFILLIISIFLLTACSKKSEEYIGNIDEKTKEEISQTILNYEYIAHPLKANLSFDENSIKAFKEIPYVKITSGYGDGSYKSFVKIVENTFTNEKSNEILNFENKNSIFKEQDNNLYFNKEDMDIYNEIKDSSNFDLDSLNIITQKDNILIVSYRQYKNNFKNEFTTNYLLLKKENGKYLADTNIYSTNIPDESMSSSIKKHYKIDDNSMFIEKFNTFSMSGKYETFICTISEINGSDLILKNACEVNLSNNIVRELDIVNGKILNYYFTDLSKKSDHSSKLLVSVSNDSNKKARKSSIDNYISVSVFGETPYNNNNEFCYVIPKYLNDQSLTIKPYDSDYTYPLLYDFFLAIDLNYEIIGKDENENVKFKFDLKNIQNNLNLPFEIEKIESNKFFEYLENLYLI